MKRVDCGWKVDPRHDGYEKDRAFPLLSDFFPRSGDERISGEAGRGGIVIGFGRC